MKKPYAIALFVLVVILVAVYSVFAFGTQSGPAESPSSALMPLSAPAAASSSAASPVALRIASSTAGTASSSAGASASSSEAAPQEYFEAGSAKIRIGIADTEAERELGLSGRASLPADEGLFFIGNAPDYIGIWMKDMNFPIDVIWLDSQLKIVDIVEDMQPDSYPYVFLPKSPAQYVLEVNTGVAKAHGIEIGQTAKITFGE